MKRALEIPQDVVDEVVAALNRAIGITLVHAKDQHEGFIKTALRFDEAINDALATEP
jgi:hypothetical protein